MEAKVIFQSKKSAKMSRHTIPVDLYIEASQVFHWATMRHFSIWFTGSSRRHRRTETVLRRLSKRGILRTFKYGKKLVYSSKPVQDELDGLAKVSHGLACTECLVRFFRSRTDGMIVAEKYFYGLGCVPEWGIVYPEGKMLLFEFSTRNDFLVSGKVKGKLEAYKKHLERIEAKFNSKAVLVYVIDIPKETLKRFLLRERPAGSVAALSPEIFFADYKTFLSIPIGEQLTASIYYWMDGKQYALRRNV